LRAWARSGGIEFYRNATDAEHPLSIVETNVLLSRALGSYRAPGLIFCHYARPDSTGHRKGMDSPEYLGALVSLDQSLGWARAATQPDIVIVCSDHGFNGPGTTVHDNAPDGFISSNLALVNNGVRRDVGYTVARMLGLPVETLDPPLRGKDLRL
jgi:phosphopentomutase